MCFYAADMNNCITIIKKFQGKQSKRVGGDPGHRGL